MSALLLLCANVLAPPASTQAAQTFYFAEGHIGDGFVRMVLSLANFSEVSGTAQVTYTFGDSPPVLRQYEVAAGRTSCVTLSTPRPLNCRVEDLGSPKDISILVTTPQDWVADRLMMFSAPSPRFWNGAHEQVGTRAPAATWYFAEGTTLKDFSEYLTIQNPDPAEAASVQVVYLTEGCSGNASRDHSVAPLTRYTIDVGRDLGDACTGVSAVVSSTLPVVVERPLYFVHPFAGNPADPRFPAPLISDGHVAFGVEAPALDWYFAEGTTLAGFYEYLTLGNPGDAPAEVSLDYVTEGAAPVTKTLVLGGRARFTVEVFNAGRPGGLGAGVEGASVHVHSSRPILAERPMYLQREFPNGTFSPTFPTDGGHVAVGAREPATRFLFVGTTTNKNTAAFLTIQNPGTSGATVGIRYTSLDQDFGSREIGVGARSRYTVPLYEQPRGGLAVPVDRPLGILLTSTAGILVEQPSYFNIGIDTGSEVVGISAATDVAGHTLV